ncbi:MAG: response regulator transcription factor [Hydrogenophaga sp.]|nr:response regulator transcription factor [Hydrogenophaga sp.]
MRIASLDDDEGQLEQTRFALKTMGHECHTFLTAKQFQKILLRESFDLLMVDWALPDSTGPEVVRWVREHVKEAVPILFLTSRHDEAAIIEGLNAGADDFMVKPVRVGELSARVTALLRRCYAGQTAEEMSWGPYHFLADQCAVEIEGQPVALTKKEFELALFMFRNTGRLLSRAHLLESVWSPEHTGAQELPSRTLDTHISKLRTLLGLQPERGFKLVSVYRQGYRLEALNDPAPA